MPGLAAGAEGVRPVGGGWSWAVPPDGSPLSRAVLCSTSSVREGPDLDGPGQDRQERERVHVDSESLDDEDS